MNARYKFSAEKAFAAVQWMVCECKALDLHTALKAVYFADKSHLNQHHQPIFGATYKAMKFGPVPLEVYEIIKGESIWLWELGRERMPWVLEGYKVKPTDEARPNLGVFSESEVEHLQTALKRSASMTFTDRTAATHGPDWQAANGGIMRYEDMVDEGADKAEIVEFIKETAARVRL